MNKLLEEKRYVDVIKVYDHLMKKIKENQMSIGKSSQIHIHFQCLNLVSEALMEKV